MGEEARLLAAIRACPHDAGPRLAYADWLEEQGQEKKAAEVRHGCRFRLPVTRAELRPLAAIAAAREAAGGDMVDVDIEGAEYRPHDAALLAEDVRHLDRDGIARHFPRDDKGRFRTSAEVVLASYGDAAGLTRDQELCLIARGPARVSAPQRITVRLTALVVENQHHDWMPARWYWDGRAAGVSEAERWGVTGEELRAVTGAGRTPVIGRLEAEARAGTLTPAGRAMLCTAYQDDGRFEEALRLCGIEAPAEVSELLDAGRPKRLRGYKTPQKVWDENAARVRRAMWRAAPWRFAEAAARSRARQAVWAAAKKGRRRKEVPMRLFMFGGHVASARPGLMLVQGPGTPGLAVEYSSFNVVMADTAWQRPVELDIARWAGK